MELQDVKRKRVLLIKSMCVVLIWPCPFANRHTHRLFMPTTWFFDGGGTNTGCPIMVLSAVGGSDDALRAFDQGWKDALQELGIRTWHSTDYFRTRNRVAKPKAPIALANVIGQLTCQEFNCVSFAADKAAVEALRIQFPDVVPTVDRMLLDLCFAGLRAAKADTGEPGRIRVLFDRGEPFIRHLKSSWQRGRTELRRAREGGWPLQIREMEPARSEDHSGLQAADLLSWVIRCRYEYGDKLVDPKIFMMMFAFMAAARLRGGFLNEAAIKSLYVEKHVPELAHGYAFV
jgi:hypothetical protein